jgi:hypothetical protein
MVSQTGSKWDDIFTAITFAEANEHDSAREFLGVKKAKKRRFSWDSIFTAVTFAEENETDTARSFLRPTSRVLLILEEGYPLNEELFRYVKNLVKPMEIGVEVFFVGQNLPQELNTYAKTLKEDGLLFRVVLVKEKSEWDKAIAEYIKEESDVEFLVIKPSFKPTKQTEDRMLRVLWQKMGVPFILIKEREFAYK